MLVALPDAAKFGQLTVDASELGQALRLVQLLAEAQIEQTLMVTHKLIPALVYFGERRYGRWHRCNST
jgi:hypothetical protein